MVTVKLFGNLRILAGEKSLRLQGETIAELLESMRIHHAVLAETICSQEGIKQHYKIMVNGVDIAQAQGFLTRIGEGDTVAIFPPIAGGHS